MFKINLSIETKFWKEKSIVLLCVLMTSLSPEEGKKRENVRGIEKEEREAFFLSLHLRYPRLFPPPLTLAPEVRSQR